MEEFCEKNDLDRKKVCFMFKGREVFQTDTPKLIGMKHGDNIDVYDRLNLFSKHYILVYIKSSYIVL